MSYFEKQVKHALIDREMTFQQLAAELELSPAYISELVRGTRQNVNQLQRIKEYLNIPEGGDDNDDTAED